MCGRYRLSRRKQLIQEYFDTADEVDWEPRYNIAPSQSVGIIRQDRAKPERRFSLARWGLIPYWAKDPGIGYKLINARSETVTSKPAFREAFERHRCLIPADPGRPVILPVLLDNSEIPALMRDVLYLDLRD